MKEKFFPKLDCFLCSLFIVMWYLFLVLNLYIYPLFKLFSAALMVHLLVALQHRLQGKTKYLWFRLFLLFISFSLVLSVILGKNLYSGILMWKYFMLMLLFTFWVLFGYVGSFVTKISLRKLNTIIYCFM